MSSKILTYKQFSSIVPKKTKEFVDKFLLGLGTFDNMLSTELSFNLNIVKAKCFHDLFIYMHDNYDSSISNILHNNYNSEFFSDYYFFEKGDINNVEIENTFNMLSGMFCIKEDEYEYYYLTPEVILFNNLNKLNEYYSTFKNTNTGNIVSDITPSDDILKELRKEVELIQKSEKLKLENDTFDNLSPETILYLKEANKIYRIINSDINMHDYNFFNVSAISLLLAFYKMPNLQFIKSYFSTINFEKVQDIRDALKKVQCDIEIPNLNSEYNYTYNIGVLCYRFKHYIDELKKIEKDVPQDVIDMLFNRKISNSSICEQIFRYNNPALDITKINEDIENYIKNKKSLETDEIYKNLPIKTCKYFEYVSKIVYILKEKNQNMNFNVCYSDSEIIDIAILISSFYRDNQITSYLSKNNITFDKILNYLNLSKEDLKLDIDKENCDIVEIYNWFKKNNFSNQAEIRNIILNTLDETILNKILSDLSGNIQNNKYTIEQYIKNEDEQKRIDLLSKFYGDLNIDIVKMLESSYVYYKYLLNAKKYFDLTNDDLVQISLLVTIYKLFLDELAKYIYEKLFSSNLLSNLIGISSIYIDSNSNIFDKEIDAKDFCKYFGKYVFGGKNKNKLKKDITINDILNNIFNKELDYSIKMKNFFSKFNLTYEDFDDLNKKYEEYLYNESVENARRIKENVLSNISSDSEFDIIDDIDKISRTIEVKNADFISSIIFIYMYYRENSFSKYLIDEGINLDKVLEYLKLSKEKVDKFKKLDTDYNHIYDVFLYKYSFIFKSSFDDIIKFMFSYNHSDFIYSSYDFSSIKTIITSLGGNFDIIKYEVENGEKYIAPLTKEEQLDEYLKMPIPNIEIKSVEEISNFGLELSNQSEIISQTFHEFIDTYSDESTQAFDLQEDFRDIYKEKTKGRKLKLFSKKSDGSPLINKKEVLDRLDNYLREKEKSLNDGLKELQHIRMLIAAYLQKANEYLKKCENAKEKLTLEISNKKYYENDFRVFDDNLKMQLLDDKISSINMNILQMIQQYQKITMQMGTHATIINQVSLARSSTIQNLYIELSLREGIEKEKESISSLNTLIGLLGNMSEMNSSEMINNINKINMLSKSEENVITDKDKELIDQILDEQNVLKFENK